MARTFGNLSDQEFEDLVQDLFSEEFGVRFESFTEGSDQGIDLRYIDNAGGWNIVQAKHYKSSTFSQLKAAAHHEAKKIAKLSGSLSSYRFVTSMGLTPDNKRELSRILKVTRDDDIFGRNDIENMLNRHQNVERRHIKLWICSSAQLQTLMQPGTHARSRVLAKDIAKTATLYVQGTAFERALTILNLHRVLIIAGPPGIGKTTLAKILLANSIHSGYEPLDISLDIDEAWSTWDEERRQIFFYDDFLGRTLLSEIISRTEGRLLKFMNSVSRAPNTLFILTTREYILQHYALSSEAARREGITTNRFLLELKSYSRLDKGKILYNHAWHSSSPELLLKELSRSDAYRAIVDHPNFNPRLIEYITGFQKASPLRHTNGLAWLLSAKAALERPDEIWQQAYEREIDDTSRLLLLCMATLPEQVTLQDLQRAFDSLCDKANVQISPKEFERTLRVLKDTFVTSNLYGDIHFLTLSNPGLADFLQRQIADDPRQARLLLRACAFFDQFQNVWKILGRWKINSRYDVFVSDPRHAALGFVYGPTARWTHSKYFPDTPRKEVISLEERLFWIIKELGVADIEDEDAEKITNFVNSAVKKWDEGKGDKYYIVPLAKVLDRQVFRDLCPTWPNAVKNVLLRASLDDVHLWKMVADFYDLFSDVFSQDERISLQVDFESFAEDEIKSWGDVESERELEELEEIAWSLRADIDDYAEPVRELWKAAEEAQADSERQLGLFDQQASVAEDEDEDEDSDELEKLFARRFRDE